MARTAATTPTVQDLKDATGVAEMAEHPTRSIAVAAIRSSVYNPRTALGDLTELAESIKTHGVLEPLILRTTLGSAEAGADADDAEPYTVIAGERRLEAARLAGRANVPAIVRDDLSEAHVEEVRLVENLQRAGLTPLEEAHAFQRLIEVHGRKQADIAMAISRNQGYVSKRLALTKLVARAERLFLDGRLSLEHAVDLAKFPANVQADLANKIALGQNPESVIRVARDRLAQLKERTALIKKLEKAGTPVIDRSSDTKALPEDARKISSQQFDAEAWAADPNRLAVVRTDRRQYESVPHQWVDYYTTAPLPEEDAAGEDVPASDGPAPDPRDDGGRPGQHAAIDEMFGAPAGTFAASTERAQADRLAREARDARVAEIGGFITTLVNGKTSPAWSTFLVRLHLVEAIVGSINDVDGASGDVSRAASALGLPTDEDYDGPDLPSTAAAVRLLVTADTSADRVLRLALATRLINLQLSVAATLSRPAGYIDYQSVIAAEVLSFLSGQGLELTESEAALVAALPADVVSVSTEYAVLAYTEAGDRSILDAGNAVPDHTEAAFEAALSEEPMAAALAEPVTDNSVAGLDDFDAPVATFRSDVLSTLAGPAVEEAGAPELPAAETELVGVEHAGEVEATAQVDAAVSVADLAAMKRPQLLELCRGRDIETTPRTTARQMVALLEAAITADDPANAIA